MTPRRQFRHLSGTLTALSQNADFKFAREHALLHFASDSICTFIPKNACSNLRISMAMANGCMQSLDDWQWIHSNNRTFNPDLRTLATAPFTFVFLRCPFRRLISVFLDKMVSQRPEYWNLRRQELDAFDESSLTFRRFVTLLGRPARLNMDPHWKPQVAFLAYETYDCWYAVETIEAAAVDLKARISLDFHDVRQRMGHGNAGMRSLRPGCYADMPTSELRRLRLKGSVPRYEDMLDEALITEISRLYKQDLATYRLHCDPRNLLVQPDAERKRK